MDSGRRADRARTGETGAVVTVTLCNKGIVTRAELAGAFALAAQQQTGAPDGRRLAVKHLAQFFERPTGGLRVITGGRCQKE